MSVIRTSNNVALYARFSSDNQRSESIDAQLRAMKAYCQQKNFVIVNTYVDEAKSATTDRRPAFQQMISDSTNGNFNILLVHKLDRFARNRYDSAVYKRELKKNGVTVYSVLENLDDSPESIMMESVLEGMSEYYSQNLAREVMKGMRETALQCKHTGGKPPLGYDVDTDTRKLVVNPIEAEAVKLIYSMYSEGYGYSPILATLHKGGYRTKNGNEFQKNSLYSILTNPKYKGLYVFNRSSSKAADGTRNTHLQKGVEDTICIDGGCPQIVDTVTFNRVQERIKNNTHTGGRGNAKTNYLLSGYVHCKECGKAMVGNTRHSGRNKDIYVTYRCPSKRYNCANKEINRDYLEASVVALLEEKLLNTAALKKAATNIRKQAQTGQRNADELRATLQNKLSEVTQGLANVADAVAAGLLSNALITRLNELEAEKAELEAALHSIKDRDAPIVDVQLILSEYGKVKDSPSSPAYKDFIRSFVSKIEIGRYYVTVTLKTGLDVLPTLDTTYTIRRQEIYEHQKRR